MKAMLSGKNVRGLCLLTIASLLAVCGCTGYRLGSTLPPGIRSIYVPTFENKSGEPQVEAESTRAVLQAFRNDGTLRVVSRPVDADVMLKVTISKYELIPLRYERDRAKTTDEYRLMLYATLELFRRGEVEPMFRQRVAGESTFEPTGSLTASKRLALPEAAKDLAHDIVESVVEYW